MRSPAELVMLLAFVAVASACATTSPTVLASAPSADASLQERDAYYEANKPLGIAGIPNAMNNFGWLVQAKFPTVILADSSRISDPVGLLPAVDESSRTAIAARKVADLKLLTNTVYTASMLALTAGLIAVTASPLALLNQGDVVAGLGLYVGGAGVALGGALGLGWATDLSEEAEAEKMSAFFLYETDLRRRLRLVRQNEHPAGKWVVPGIERPPPLVSPPDASDPVGP